MEIVASPASIKFMQRIVHLVSGFQNLINFIVTDIVNLSNANRE